MPEGIGYGMTSVKVPNMSGKAKAIPPKGLSTAGNGPPPRTGRPRIPENSAKLDHSSGQSAPKRGSNAPMKTERKPSLGGQRMRESGKGFSKR
jgi:hypothetical protein